MSDENIEETMDMDTRTLYAEAVLGRDALDFLNSELGRLMRETCEVRRKEALEKFLEVDPTNVDAVIQVKLEAMRYATFLELVTEVVRSGKMAEHTLENIGE